MRTISQALRDEAGYPLREGFISNRLLSRSLDGDVAVSAETLRSHEFLGALADTLWGLVTAPNVTEADMSITLPDRAMILRRANAIYSSIGEEEKSLDIPKVSIGWKG